MTVIPGFSACIDVDLSFERADELAFEMAVRKGQARSIVTVDIRDDAALIQAAEISAGPAVRRRENVFALFRA